MIRVCVCICVCACMCMCVCVCVCVCVFMYHMTPIWNHMFMCFMRYYREIHTPDEGSLGLVVDHGRPFNEEVLPYRASIWRVAVSSYMKLK